MHSTNMKICCHVKSCFFEFVMHTLAFLLLFVYILMLQLQCFESVDLRTYLERGLDRCSQ